MTFDDSYNIGHLKLNIVNVPSKMIDETSDLNEINKICVEFGTVEYHLICFCVSINTGINEQDIELFKRLVEHFGNGKIRPNLCLVVTRSESKDEESRETILDELENDVHFNYVIKQLGRGVYFSGALNSQDWHRANEEPLLDQFRTIHEYRRSLLQSIMTNIDPFVMKIKTVAMVSESAESGLNKREIIQKDRDLENTSQSESIHNQENQDVWSQSTEGIDPRSVSSTSIFNLESKTHENAESISSNTATSDTIDLKTDLTITNACASKQNIDDQDLENTSQSESIHNQENQDVWSQSTEGIDPRSVSSTSIFNLESKTHENAESISSNTATNDTIDLKTDLTDAHACSIDENIGTINLSTNNIECSTDIKHFKQDAGISQVPQMVQTMIKLRMTRVTQTQTAKS
ncbi:unnamed protein product [Adineta steineri]|uniref:AIG1-type G domain-containing protein n=1 Tax=Adineta steineri TaxID=433720 RepID=A0A819FXS8_9BILA|nr:unnamed protein product [Adineta steineri]